MYAIIATGGKQYKVSEGDVIKVEKLKKLSFTSTREKQATTKNRVTDSLILKLRLKKLMLN